jgi:Tripartite tricarboxylate transporter TctA family
MQSFNDLIAGFYIALEPQNFLWCFIGVTIGNIVGVLPGMGVVSAISILLPLTFGLKPITAILMLSGIFYGAQYGGAICSIPRSFAYCWANLFQIFQDQKIAHAFTLKQSHNKHQDINHPVVYMP